MKCKIIMLVTFMLLAILMVGSVSAGNNADFNETLTIDDADVGSSGASANDEIETLTVGETGGDLEVIDENTLNDGSYGTFVVIDREINIDSDEGVAGITLEPELRNEGASFVILNGDNAIYKSLINGPDWYTSGDDYKCTAQLNKINLTHVKDGDDLKITFIDSNGNEIKKYREMVRVGLNDSIIKFYYPSLYLDFSIDCETEFSIDDLQTVFANVTVTRNLEGRIVLRDTNGTILYNKNTNDFNEDYIHVYDYGLTLGDDGKFIFGNLNDGDVVIFDFYADSDEKILSYSFSVHFKNNGTVQFEDIGYDESLYFIFIHQDGRYDGWGQYGALMAGINLNPKLIREGGYFVIMDGGSEMYRSHTSEFANDDPRHWHVGNGFFKCHAYTIDINLKNVYSGDLIKFTFINSQGVEIEKYTIYRFISITGSDIHFLEKGDSNLKIDAANIYEGDNATITITARPLFTGNVTVEIGNSSYVVQVTNGTGKLSVSGLEVGKYTATATLNATDLLYTSVKDTDFIVKGKTNIKASSISTTYGTSKTLVVTLKDAKGNLLVNKNVSIVLNGVKTTLKTNSKSQVSLPIGTKLAANKYTAKFTFAGDSLYDKSSGSVNVVVSKAKPKLTAKNKDLKLKKAKKYSVILKTDKGKALSKVSVTIKVNGVKYTAKTNSNGKATFNLKKLTKKGKWSAKVEFKGNKNFSAVTKSVKISVKK